MNLQVERRVHGDKTYSMEATSSDFTRHAALAPEPLIPKPYLGFRV